MIAIGIALLAIIYAFFAGLPHLSYYSGSNFLITGITWFAGLLLVIIPILFLIFLLARIFSDYRVKKRIRNSMIGTWLASVIIFVFSVAFHIPKYANNSSITESNKVELENNIVKIKFDDFESDDELMFNVFDTRVNKYALYGDHIRVNIYKSDSSYVNIEKEISSQGRTRSNAIKHAKQVNINEKVNDNTISIPEYYRIDKGDKYRGQNVIYNIYIPKDKKVEIANSLYRSNIIRKNEFRKKRD